MSVVTAEPDLLTSAVSTNRSRLFVGRVRDSIAQDIVLSHRMPQDVVCNRGDTSSGKSQDLFLEGALVCLTARGKPLYLGVEMSQSDWRLAKSCP
jgi:hypothetical protein